MVLSEISKWKNYLFEPVSASVLGLFRILWGLVMGYYFLILVLGGGKYKYLDTVFHFKYPFFEWVQPLSNDLMYSLFFLGLFSSLMISIGLYYRLFSKLLFAVYTYIFLLDVSYWNNHYYAYMLINFFFMISDAHRSFSLDHKRLSLDSYVPRWQLLILQFQIVLIYFYGGLSKLQNKDWMSNQSGYSLVYHNLGNEKLPHHLVYPLSLIITYGGLLYDLLIGFLLLNRRTLWYCLPLILCFNFFNSFLFNIGTFPYAMIASFVLFVPEDWLKRWLPKSSRLEPSLASFHINAWDKKIIFAVLHLFIIFQLMFPFRSFLYEGSVFWTGEGKLCAWHMMSSSTYVKADEFELLEMDTDNRVVLNREKLDINNFLEKKQIRTMGTFPFLIPQFAKFLKMEAENAGFQNVAIKGKIYVSRNYRPMTLLIDPDKDLASLEVKRFGHNDWILRYQQEDGYFSQ